MVYTFRITKIALLFAAAFLLVVTAYAAYKGHADDSDVNAILTGYPDLKNTAVDSCATCHKGGAVPDALQPKGMRSENSCGYCHAVYVKGRRDIRETLGRYGADYLAAGRGVEAVKALARKDSDGDGFTNEAEFYKGTNPGEPVSNPSAPVAPNRVYALSAIREMPSVASQTVFLNTSHNKAGDFYNEYRGARIYEMLQAAGISGSAESVDFISYDGFEGAFAIDELKKSWPQAAPVMGLSKKEMGSCGWINYNARSLDASKALPNVSVMLAFEENSKPIDAARLDPATGKIVGTGPLRLVVPQYRISPPDLPQYAEKSCQDKVAPKYRFNADYDHNGGRSSFAIVAIRVKPLPKGTRDFEWEKVRDQFVAEGKLVIFGALKKQKGK
jgi:hypothetical protein